MMKPESTSKHSRPTLNFQAWRSLPDKYVEAAFLVLVAIFLGFDIQSRPIVLWDESRVVSNALEMSKTGFSLITTYDFKPDLWNTKPPLVIWIIAASIRLFGASEWTVRLPSLIAAVLTAAITLRMTWWLTRSRLSAYLSVAILVLSPGFYGEHAAQSADYDTILGLFVTVYLFSFFYILHHQHRNAIWVALFGAAVVLACLTKGVAGLIPGVGIPIYLILQKRWSRLIAIRYFATAAATVFLIGAYYYFREQADPGYLAAVKQSELGGRFVVGVAGHFHSPVYYLTLLFFLFSIGPCLALLPAAAFVKWPKTRSSAFFLYGLIVCVCDVLTLSVSQTKIYWYLVPIYPILSVTTLLFLTQIWMWFWRLKQQIVKSPAFVLTLIFMVVLTFGVYEKLVVLPAVETSSQGQYGRLFDRLSQSGVSRLIVLDSGVNNTEGLVNYSPMLHFYSVIWADRGLSSEILHASPTRTTPGSVIVTCDPKFLDSVRALGRPIAHVQGCAAVVSAPNSSPT